jgi:hypothetical protein
MPALKNEVNSDEIFQIVVGPSNIGKTWAYMLAADGCPYVAYISLREVNSGVSQEIAMQLEIPQAQTQRI